MRNLLINVPTVRQGFKMRDIYELFLYSKHPSDVNDYYHTLTRGNILNTIYWWKNFELIQGIEGDIIECGVGRGRSLITILSIYKYLEKLDPDLDRTIYALDSFEGFPDPTEHDVSARNSQKGDWSHSPNNEFNYSPKNLSKILQCADLEEELERVKIVKGFFDKTTANMDVDKIAILHLDGDLYESVLRPLENLWSKISIGGIVVVDDFVLSDPEQQKEKFPGARIAINEFLSQNDKFRLMESCRGTPILVRKMD